MSSENLVKGFALDFGTSGTLTQVATASTATTNPQHLPREDYSVQINAIGTGTSTAVAACVWQVSNDNVAWFGLSSATATAGQTSTSTTINGAAVVGTAPLPKFAYGRAVITLTGTGAAAAVMGI